MNDEIKNIETPFERAKRVEKCRKMAKKLRGQGLKLREIAEKLGIKSLQLAAFYIKS